MLLELIRRTWRRYMVVHRVRQTSRAWVDDDGALVLKVRRD